MSVDWQTAAVVVAHAWADGADEPPEVIAVTVKHRLVLGLIALQMNEEVPASKVLDVTLPLWTVN